jgi:hypothetical protein
VARRAAAVDERRRALGAGLLAPSDPDEAVSDDLSGTMRVAWELIATLRGSLLSLEERATRVVPAEIAGLIALWTQLHAFDVPAARLLAWAAWATLLVAILVLAVLVMPSRLTRFWNELVPPELVLTELRPLVPEEEARIALQLSTALHAQIDRLRRGFRLTISLSATALLLTALAYLIEQT